MGAAPRCRGRSDPCTFTQPKAGSSSTARGRISPYAATTITSGLRAVRPAWAAGSRRVRGCSTTSPRAMAACFTGDSSSRCPRPAGRSGWVSTPATS